MGISKTCRSRRAVLAGIASAAALPIAAAIPAGAKATVPEAADPIFAAIDAHRKAHAASAAAMTEIRRLGDLADSIVGDGIEVPCMIGEGSIRATIWLDIEHVIPKETFPVEHAHYLELLSQHQTAHREITGDTDPIGEKEYAAEWRLVNEFAETVPTTLAGLFAKLIYADKMLERDNDPFSESFPVLIESLATAARALTRAQS